LSGYEIEALGLVGSVRYFLRRVFPNFAPLGGQPYAGQHANRRGPSPAPNFDAPLNGWPHAKDVAAALNTLKLQAAVDKAEAGASSQNAAPMAGLTQIVQGLQDQDPRAVAIEGLSAPVQKVLTQVGQMSPYQAHDPATAAQRSQAEQGLLALAGELAPADNAARKTLRGLYDLRF
jgi:hypothetical protein